MTRLVGAVLVFAATSLVGVKAYVGLKNRAATISALIAVLDLMRAEIVYRLAPLSDALTSVQRAAPREAQPFVNDVSEEIARLGCAAFDKCWTAAAARFPEPERSILTELAPVLGRFGADEQRIAIDLAVERLKRVHAQAEANVGQSGKVYITLGVCSGIALAVVLI